MSPPVLISLSVLLLVLCFLAAAISALETALLRLREQHAKSLAGGSHALLNSLNTFNRSPQRQLNHVILLGSVLHLLIATIVLFLFQHITLPGNVSPVVALLVLFTSIIILIELLPTLVALARPDVVFRFTARPLLLINPVLDPIAESLIEWTDKGAAFFTPEEVRPRSELMEDELETLVELRREQGILQESESEMIHEILKLGHKTAKDCMTPRVDAVALSNELPQEVADEFIRRHSHWYIPVYRESPDSIVGILDARAYLHDSASDYRKFIRPPVFVPETMMALDVFRDYLKTPHSLAIVLDEFGGMEGVISQTDLIEEVIADAAPQNEQALEIQDLGKGRLLAAGNARLDEIGEILDVDIEEEGLDTIGGLLFTTEDRVPRPGERIRLNGIVATVRECSARRIESVLVERCGKDADLEPPPESPPAASAQPGDRTS